MQLWRGEGRPIASGMIWFRTSQLIQSYRKQFIAGRWSLSCANANFLLISAIRSSYWEEAAQEPWTNKRLIFLLVLGVGCLPIMVILLRTTVRPGRISPSDSSNSMFWDEAWYVVPARELRDGRANTVAVSCAVGVWCVFFVVSRQKSQSIEEGRSVEARGV